MNQNNMKILTRFLRPFSDLIIRKYRPNIRQRVILTYHGISKTPQCNCVTQDLFKEQISWLKEKYSVVPLLTLVENLKAPFLQNQSDIASITFDDGFVNFAELALPILQEFGCNATIFVPTGKIGGYNDWDEGTSGFHKMAIMSYRELRQLPEKFVEIGSHGISHIPLDGRLPFSVSSKEIVGSRLILEQNIGKPVRIFAFPFGVYPFWRKLRLNGFEKQPLAGYSAACTTWWGRYNSMKDIYTLRRIGIWDSDSLADFIDKLDGYYDWLEGKERVGRFLKLMSG